MTLDEKTRILAAVSTADGGCSNCVQGLLEELDDLFPDVDFKALWATADGSTFYDKRRFWERLGRDMQRPAAPSESSTET